MDQRRACQHGHDCAVRRGSLEAALELFLSSPATWRKARPVSAPPPFTTSPLSSAVPGARRNHPLAITGLVLSCLALVPCCCCGPLLSTVAVILCAIALSQISQEPDKWTGKNLAIIGIVLALLSFLAFAGFWLLDGNFMFKKAPFRFR